MTESPHTDTPSGLIIKKTKVSMAFSLITFMVGELIFVEESITPPVDISLYEGLNRQTFKTNSEKVLKILEDCEEIQLNMEESIFLYMIIDLACKCMVNDANESLQKFAMKNLDIGNKDYDKARMSYLQYAESLIKKMNMQFKSDVRFDWVVEKLHS